MFDIEFYRTRNGSCPMESFLDSLDSKMAVKALQELSLLAEKGIELREPHSKAIGDGLFELRIKLGSDISRAFYFFLKGRRIIVTNGFIKKSQKTPSREIRRARLFKQDWEERYGS
ncbi:type II toxin-antitoxin system RelE/ParE family toxin [Adlercreutzia sp. R25]|uniref:type II toxin-antitoxin system RelE/ParE family toxin n=1 Tax=Adlercreutzia shanghongiae TaxID=3111773 RepID=UPI002DBAEF23|nr:type II toxin-antitoxin system RelE/ParE family toxin [Adlercreutzia sp. R25]MEC4273387.1 type II toxin-antitoxin system RelE/ParE family toxin [Adlercreutzia sp. R25]